MNPLTRHPHQQGVTYWEHFGFAMGIAFRLLLCMTAFALHAMFPFISIDRSNDLEATAAYLEERNHWIETAHDRAPDDLEIGHRETGMPTRLTA